jgi:FkbM family methyltransferase
VPDLWEYYGLARSLLIYNGRPFRTHKLTAFYSELIRPGDLCFDIGAHVGTHTKAMRRLGARVIALEPQPLFHRFLDWLFKSDPQVILIDAAAGRTPRRGSMQVSRKTPTVSTLSVDWIENVRDYASFKPVRWEKTIDVSIVTLDDLVDRFGCPDFCKIDVEGFEAEVLYGLRHPIRQLSFEYIAGELGSLDACLERLANLGDYRYNWSKGEQMRLANLAWTGGEEARKSLSRLEAGAGHVDIYARRQDLEAPAASI